MKRGIKSQTINGLDKLIDSMMNQLLALCYTDSILLSKVKDIKNEFRRIDEDDQFVTNKQIKLLYKALHATRAFDTGLRTFLDAHHIALNDSDTPSMGCYLLKLTQPSSYIKQLSGLKKTRNS